MRKKLFIAAVICISLLLFNMPLLANNLAFQNYKLALNSLETKDWEQARIHLNEVILNDLPNSQFLGKAIYLKTVLLAAEVKRDVELKNYFADGKNKTPITQKEKQTKLDLKIKNYQASAERKVDTLIGLANYLVANTPPLDIKLDYLYNNVNYDQDVISQIKGGSIPEKERLKELEQDLVAGKVNDYLQLTLDVKGFNNLSVIKARQGDNLYDLAREYDIPFYLMLSANSHIENPNKIYPGEKIYLPKLSAAYVNYPAYFYYISNLAYKTNPERREDIMRLVKKAYQLTNAEDKTTEEYINNKAGKLSEQLNVEQYKERLTEQSERIEQQQKELKELQEKYNQLLIELEKLKATSKDDQSKAQENEGGNENFGQQESKDYDPDKDPLTY